MGKSQSLRSKLSFSNVISVIALFVALGGGVAFAAATIAKNSVTAKSIKKNAVRGSEIKTNAVTGKDANESTFEKVPLAALADLATTVPDGSINGPKIADGSVNSAKMADGSVNSAKIADGQVGAADLAADEPFHVVGAGGEPSFGTGGDGDCIWSDATAVIPDLQPTSFYKDKNGRVHLSVFAQATDGGGGDAMCDSTTGAEEVEDFRVFTLPPNARPDRLTILPAIGGGGNTIAIIGADSDTVIPNVPPVTIPAGAVIASGLGGSGAALIQDSFRAAG